MRLDSSGWGQEITAPDDADDKPLETSLVWAVDSRRHEEVLSTRVGRPKDPEGFGVEASGVQLALVGIDPPVPRYDEIDLPS